MNKKFNSILVIFVIIISLLIYVGYNNFFNSNPPINTTNFIHTSKATFALIAQPSVEANNSIFIQNIRNFYFFSFATSSNFTKVQNDTYVVLVADNSSSNPVNPIAQNVLKTNLNLTIINQEPGSTYFYNNLWALKQTVFILYNYNQTELTHALDNFVINQNTPSPQLSIAKPNLLDPATLHPNATTDPILDASYGPYCLNSNSIYCQATGRTPLQLPYNYYVGFSYALYAAGSEDGFDLSTGSGNDMPSYVGICAPPPDGACVAVYIGLPVFETPAGIINPSIDLSMENEGGDLGVSGSINIGSFLTSSVSETPTGGSNVTGQECVTNVGSCPNEVFSGSSVTTMQLIQDNVLMYSNPVGYITGFFTWSYGIYPLVQTFSNIGGLKGQTATNYGDLFIPYQLTTPATFTNSTGTYSFSYWSINAEIGTNTYNECDIINCDNPTVPVDLIGPTQAEAVYFLSAKAGTVSGKVGYYPNNVIPISGAKITFTDSQGNVVATAISDSNGYYSTSELQPGVYNVTATEKGYNFIPQQPQVFIYGDIVDNITELSYPMLRAPVGNIKPILPTGQCGPVNVEAFYPNGQSIPTFLINSFMNYGEITSPMLTNTSGIATFTWCAKDYSNFNLTPDIYYTSFSAVLDHYPLNTIMTNSVVNLSLSVGNRILPVFNGSSTIQPILANFMGHYLGPYFTYKPAVLIASGLPTKAIANFTPKSIYPSYPTTSALGITINGSTLSKNYVVTITATVKGPSWWSTPLVASATFTLQVIPCNTTNGGIYGTIIDNDGRTTNANVSITEVTPSGNNTKYWYNTTTGVFNTGYQFSPGVYNVSVFLNNLLFLSQLVNVTSCRLSQVILTQLGALNINVNFHGNTAYNASVSLVYPGNVTITGWTDYLGQCDWNGVQTSFLHVACNPGGYTVPVANYTLEITYNGFNLITNLRILPAKITTVTVDLYPSTIVITYNSTIKEP